MFPSLDDLDWLVPMGHGHDISIPATERWLEVYSDSGFICLVTNGMNHQSPSDWIHVEVKSKQKFIKIRVFQAWAEKVKPRISRHTSYVLSCI